MPFKMSQHKERVIVCQGFPHIHLCKPFSVVDRKRDRPLCVHDIHRTEIPAVYFQCFPVLFRGVPSSLVVGIRLDNSRSRQVSFNQFFHPRPRDDIRSMGFAGMQLDTCLSGNVRAHAGKDPAESFRRQVSCEIDNRFFSAPFII